MSVFDYYTSTYRSISSEARKLWAASSKELVSDVEKFQRQIDFDDYPVVNSNKFSSDPNSTFLDHGAQAGLFLSPSVQEQSLLAKIFFRNDKEEQARSQLTALHLARDAGITNVPSQLHFIKTFL
jgi:hypothetical protein